MDISMSVKEMENFLSKPNIARIATIQKSNKPHVTPLWYLWSENQVFIIISQGSKKEQNIRKNPNVAVTIDTDSTPNKGVIFEGTAEIQKFDEEILRRICQRYLQNSDLEKYIEYSKEHFSSTLIKIHVTKTITWDNAKDPFVGNLSYK